MGGKRKPLTEAGKAKQAGYRRAYYERNRQKMNEQCRDYKRRLKAEMVAAYGGRCECCGEAEITFLTLEHVNRDGADHKRRLGTNGGHAIWLDLKKRGWPKDGFTLLCWNCNCSTKNGAACAHKCQTTYQPGLLAGII